jgi:hypothetical protein
MTERKLADEIDNQKTIKSKRALEILKDGSVDHDFHY